MVGTQSTDIERKIGFAIERMPAFPRSVQRVLELTRDINCRPKDLVGVIEKDPVMTMRILKVINSAYYALPTRIASVSQSVVYLGINTIKSLSLSVAAAGMLPNSNLAGFDTRRYLIHSLATAGVARQLCMSVGHEDNDAGDSYVVGLLHDFGKVVFSQSFAADFRKALALSAEEGIPLHEAERRLIGIDHAQVGAMLVAKWTFPAAIVECIRDHHTSGVASSVLRDSLLVADQICRGLTKEDIPVDWEGRSPDGTTRFGDNMASIIDKLGNLKKIIDEARDFAQVEHSK